MQRGSRNEALHSQNATRSLKRPVKSFLALHSSFTNFNFNFKAASSSGKRLVFILPTSVKITGSPLRAVFLYFVQFDARVFVEKYNLHVWLDRSFCDSRNPSCCREFLHVSGRGALFG